MVVLCKGLLCVERYFLLCAEPRTLLSSSLLYLKVPQAVNSDDGHLSDGFENPAARLRAKDCQTFGGWR